MAISAGKITSIRKRDGRIATFQPEKIEAAVRKAFEATRVVAGEHPRIVAEEVVRLLETRMGEGVPTVEQVQDAVEEVLMAGGHAPVAKAYILYRHRRTEIRNAKQLLGVQDELKLSINAIRVLERRYLLRDELGGLAETPIALFRRVARAVAAAESRFGGDTAEAEELFFSAMRDLEFLPNSPTLMNAGAPLGQLSACFVIPVEDSIAAIFDAVKSMALIHQSGGGTGFSFSRLRPRGDIVRSTSGIASGPVSFMRVFDTGTEVIKQGGKRRGANMGILRVDHPDILEFIQAKDQPGMLANFNVSVAATDAFMEAAEKGEDYGLINPRTHREVRRLNARHVFNLIASSAWKTGDPGMVFIDEVNRGNPTPRLGVMESTNPCGELPLLPYESCNLGSINLVRMVSDHVLDWEKLAHTTRMAVRFLDDVVETNHYPLPEVEAITKGNRKIGLGVMGFADALVMLGIPYDSGEGLAFARDLMAFILRQARGASEGLARQRGVFPNYGGSVYDRPGGPHLRNSTVTSVAPTGTISIIAGCSSGVEPLFALSYVRKVLEGARLLEVNPLFEKVARDRGFYSQGLLARVARTGTLKDMDDVPADVRRLFVTDFEITPEWHVRMQAAFQEHCDNAVSKTINLPEDATIDDVRGAYQLAYRLKCKGITVFRYGSRGQQVLYRGDAMAEEPLVTAGAEYSGGCPDPACEF